MLTHLSKVKQLKPLVCRPAESLDISSGICEMTANHDLIFELDLIQLIKSRILFLCAGAAPQDW